ncbi:MAG: hypothetical protein U5L95_01600 [Candidatus Saccharibacteria bacterium]|nr:hypothetical protein [Candidatus Saccharibacteria bacterium]
MARLPVPGGDVGNWGEILNSYLKVSHDSGGAIKSGSVTNGMLAGSIAQNKITNLTSDLADKYVLPGGGVPEADLDSSVQTKLNQASTHIADGTAAHAASAIGFTPAGSISSTDVQAALTEIDTDVTAIPEAVAGRMITITPTGSNTSRFDVLPGVARRVGIGTTTGFINNQTGPFDVFDPINVTGMVQGDELHIQANGYWKNNSGSAASLTLYVAVNATTIATFAASSIATNATNRAWTIDLKMTCGTFIGATLFGGGISTLGATDNSQSAERVWSRRVSQAFDYTNDFTVNITAEHDVADANVETWGIRAAIYHTIGT